MDNAATSEEIAWAAGLFEGEGTVTISGDQLIARIQSTDKDVLDRFEGIIGGGRMYGPYTSGYRDGYRRKPRWVWLAADADAFDAIGCLAPWLCQRRRAQTRSVFNRLDIVVPRPFWDMARFDMKTNRHNG